jgi:putative polyhydroxyalkanoate system protein
MPGKTLDISVPHNLGREEARRRVERGVGEATARYAGTFGTLEQTWSGDRLDFAVTALGQRLSGWLEVQENAVQIHVVLPWLLARIAEKLKPQIESAARDALKLPPPGPPPKP